MATKIRVILRIRVDDAWSILGNTCDKEMFEDGSWIWSFLEQRFFRAKWKLFSPGWHGQRYLFGWNRFDGDRLIWYIWELLFPLWTLLENTFNRFFGYILFRVWTRNIITNKNFGIDFPSCCLSFTIHRSWKI